MMAAKITYRDIDHYIACFPEDVQVILEKMRAIIQKAAPGAKETISYQIPAFTLNGNLVHFAGYKKHVGFYPGASAIVAFKKEISDYKNAKGSVQFPLDKPLPLTLIRKIVQFRMKANLEKSKFKSRIKKTR